MALIQDKEKEENDSQLHYCAIQQTPVIGLFPLQALTLRFDTRNDHDLYAHAGATGRSMIRKAQAARKSASVTLRPAPDWLNIAVVLGGVIFRSTESTRVAVNILEPHAHGSDVLRD